MRRRCSRSRGVLRRFRHGSCGDASPPLGAYLADLHARVVQHKCDHLQGKLYPMRVRDSTKFGITEVMFPGLHAGERPVKPG